MALTQQYTAIIFDLGDVLFKWSPETKTSISARKLRDILNSPIWFEYERGHLSENDCYAQVGTDFDIEPEEIRRALEQARESLHADHELIALIRELKAGADGQLKVFAMSNISVPDWEILRTKPADWGIFDRIFTSGKAGERKPHLGFYRHVLSTTGVDPHSMIFVDDRPENVFSARSLGMHGIVFEHRDQVARTLRNLIGDPVVRGRDYLKRNAGHLVSVWSKTDKMDSIELHDNFTQLLILEATKDLSLVNLVEHPRTWNFFQVLRRDEGLASSVINEMLEYVDADGIIQTYFDHRRPRLDAVVCVNVLTMFYAYDRGTELQKTLEWVKEVLQNHAYLDGTRYYDTAECFLFFVSRLLASSDDPELHATLMPLLKKRVQERIGAEGDSLALAMRILVCAFVGIRGEVDLHALLPLQREDGGWEIGWIYKTPGTGARIGNRGLTTALAVKAIETMACNTSSMSLDTTRTSTHVGPP
ncbi:hypothetical protein Hypma_001818 [Hypsizygus marmoreus]|uniref:Alpha-D-glucose-1-phosphate phosphatase YihX n=1 Tax=Hypsizygus marmoreus TaxID=39966 RepID=A0A369JD56_HYPMA|nr:hypothetical protein Hypma_001818 [Hypsizygus marmoreus]